MPGVNPPTGTESEEIRRLTATAGLAAAEGADVGICEKATIACPHEEQYLLLSVIGAEHAGQCMSAHIILWYAENPVGAVDDRPYFVESSEECL